MKSDGVSQGSYPACPSSSSKPRETVSQQGCGLSVFTCPKVGRDTRTCNYDRAGAWRVPLARHHKACRLPASTASALASHKFHCQSQAPPIGGGGHGWLA